MRGLVQTLRRPGDPNGEPYLTRVKLTPQTRWGQLRLHIFHRGDQDRDPHDHPMTFWTFPFHDYVEMVMDEQGRNSVNVVQALRWQRRDTRYTHRVLGAMDREKAEADILDVREGRFVTLVWNGPITRPDWGFWVPVVDPGREGDHGDRRFVSHEVYMQHVAQKEKTI